MLDIVKQSAEVLQFPVQTKKDSASVVVVVPCYNEEKRLNSAAFVKFLDMDPTATLLFVNDGSKDNTLEVLAEIHRRRPEQVEVISLERNGGKAEAVRLGIQHAANSGAAYIAYWDADLATPLEYVEDFVKTARRFPTLRVVYGSRRQMLGHKINRTLTRRAISRTCSALAQVATDLPIRDTQCGAKLLKNTPELRQAIATPFTAGWLFDIELFTRLSNIVANKYTAFYEMALPEWNEIEGSKVTAKAIIKAGMTMLKLIMQNRFSMPIGKKHIVMNSIRTEVICSRAQNITFFA